MSGCIAAGVTPFITLETVLGLNSHTRKDIETFAQLLRRYRTPVMLRWNHEMNGSWYAWGQKPALYVKKFREFAVILSRSAKNVSFVWSPNQAWGNPWGGSPSAQDFARLDTNQDGALSAADDPYAPFYPGDEYVDWVGLSLYHWGNRDENGYNEVPNPYKFAAALGLYGGVADFHRDIAEKFNEPMIIAETAAYFDTTNKRGGDGSEEEIKSSWLDQVFSLEHGPYPNLLEDFSRIKAIMWFEILKHENETSSVVDWRVANNASVRARYQSLMSDPYFLKNPPLGVCNTGA